MLKYLRSTMLALRGEPHKPKSRRTESDSRRRASQHTQSARIESAIAAGSEAPGNTMSYRGIFEMVGGDVLRELRLNKDQAHLEVLRLRTANDTPMYLINIVVNHPALLNPRMMGQVEATLKDHVRVVSRWALHGLRGITWSVGRDLASRSGSPVNEEAPSKPPVGAQPLAATDFGHL